MRTAFAALALFFGFSAPVLAETELPPMPERVQLALLVEWAIVNCDVSALPGAALMAPIASAMIQSQPADAIDAHRAEIRALAGDDIPGYCTKVLDVIQQQDTAER